jgi:hypothetical protein
MIDFSIGEGDCQAGCIEDTGYLVLSTILQNSQEINNTGDLWGQLPLILKSEKTEKMMRHISWLIPGNNLSFRCFQ